MRAQSDSDLVARTDPDASAQSDLYDLFRAGSRMFEQPTVRRTLRIAAASAKAIAGCAVLAAYVAEGGRLTRYSGRANRRLDVLVEARAGKSGLLEGGHHWRYALFFRATGRTTGAFVLQTIDAPSREAVFLLHALAEPTGAALATAELIEHERRQASELRQFGEAQAGSNRTLTATIVRLNSHQHIREVIVAAAGAADGETRIVEALSRITRRSIALQDSFGSDRAFAGVGDSVAPGNMNQLFPPHVTTILNPGWQSTRIRSGVEALGVLGIYDPEDARSADDRFAVDYASAMIAVEFAHHRRLAEVEIRLGGDLADDLVAGIEVIDGPARAEALHFDLGGAQRVMLVSWEHPPPTAVDIGAAVRSELEAMRVPALISRRPGTSLVVVADSDLSTLHDRLSSRLGTSHGAIGVGGRCVTTDLPRSWTEATRALHVRMGSPRPYGLSNYDDLGLLRILVTSGDGLELDRYLTEWLGPLVEHDQHHRSELVHTLTLYLDSGGHYDRTADALMIHRSTLRYRLGKIRELSGRDLSDPDHRLNLHIAVRARAASLAVLR